MNPELVKLARRIETMTPKGTEQETIYNFAFGALYALASAELHGYPNQSSKPGRSKRRADEVRMLAAEMATKEALPEAVNGEWLGGFYFNDALFRGYVCFERLLRHRTKRKGKLPNLVKKAQEGGFDVATVAPDWKDISKEVNNLKHSIKGFPEGPTITYPDAVKRVQTIIDAVEWVFKHSPDHKATAHG